MNEKIFEVSELNNIIKRIFDAEDFLNRVSVRGEISNYKLYPSGHHYFTVKDKESALRCVMFKGQSSSLGFRPENGMRVVAFGRVSVFPRDGVYQLYCAGLKADGEGDLNAAFERLKEKLSKEGLFDRDKKKPIPKYPERIVIITSSAGAAVRDIIRILGRRYPLAKVLLMPVRVQGIEAPPEICGALRYANRFKLGDVIITGRGGGSIEDLWAFNDENVARAIFASEIPVISAVGHEPDITIADYVADLRAATPSNAAELAVPDVLELSESVKTSGLRMAKALTRRLEMAKERLRVCAESRIMTNPMIYVEDRRALLDYSQDRLASTVRRMLSEKRESYIGLASALDAMSPLKVLARGYSVVRKADGSLVKSEKDVRAGEQIGVRLHRGEIRCEVLGEIDDG